MTRSNPIPICIPDGTPLPAAVKKLSNNDGHGGRSRVTLAALGGIKPDHESQWKLNAHTKIHNRVECASTGVDVPDCSTQQPLLTSQKPPPLPPKNIITNYQSLKKMIEENVVCKHCSEMRVNRKMDDFLEYARE